MITNTVKESTQQFIDQKYNWGINSTIDWSKIQLRDQLNNWLIKNTIEGSITQLIDQNAQRIDQLCRQLINYIAD